MAIYLDIQAGEAAEFCIDARGRDAGLVASLKRNLLIETYRSLAPQGPPLWLKIENQIPLGMGCGSSAAALLAGVRLANHFGELGMTPQQVLEEACRREGHPDNVAACFHGGLTASAMDTAGRVTTASFAGDPGWRLLLALPAHSLATTAARALLPESYSRADAVANVQATALLVSAFALNRPELLRAGTQDRLHQPYRGDACPLLPALLPLAEDPEVYAVTLSGAGPAVLVMVAETSDLVRLSGAMRRLAKDGAMEVLVTSIAAGGASDIDCDRKLRSL